MTWGCEVGVGSRCCGEEEWVDTRAMVRGVVLRLGVLAPVATGVVKFDGSSEEKMVALEGEMRYLALRVASRASLKPVRHR